jgi:serine/threonine protein kinase
LIDAVQWVHLHGFVHLNIHPMTILNANLTQVNIKLSGFENAVHLSQLNKLNEQKTSSLNLMPLEFNAPEILNDELVDMQTDIWSIGLMAALLLSGSSPFYHETNQETTKANISFCRLTFDEFYDDVTGEAVLFIQQCLKRSPDNRLTLQECIDHKLFNLSVSNSKKREEILFLSEKIKCFNHELQKRLSNSS